MCGIVAVLGRPSRRGAPELAGLLAAVGGVADGLAATDPADADLAALVDDLAGRLEEVDRQLRGPVGLACMLAGAHAGPAPGVGVPPAGAGRPEPVLPAVDAIAAAVAPLDAAMARIEGGLDAGAGSLDSAAVEEVNAAIGRLRDAWWAVGRDRLGAARAVAGCCPAPLDVGSLGAAALGGLWSLHVALASIDRLEVRGRDSAGVHVLVTGHGLDLDTPEVAALLASRAADPLFASMAVRSPAGALSLVYKAAAEIGELGDNVRALRAAVAADRLLGAALASPDARVTVLGHTRWASVGVVSEANAHPVNSDELGRRDGPYVTAALNGDVDNHAELRLADGLELHAEITTDAKVIPTMIARRIDAGEVTSEAFRTTVGRFDGSVAVAASSADDPDRIELALRGSGQSLYVGLADDAFVVASEPYGLVEETSRFVRMDGEVTRGQVVSLARHAAGTTAGVTRATYDGGLLPVDEGDVSVAEITTRDIDRAGFPHFLLKEVSEAPASLRKTLRGKILAGSDGRLTVRLGPDVLPPAVVAAVADHRITRVLVIGQGTAAVAGRAVADAFSRSLPGVVTSALPATELSGFGLSDDMSDTLTVAISQSGTTADTNRTVDLVRARRGAVVAVVNRRNSDLTAKADGVLYTSDGRDVEMAVASTKAFYSQVAAGWLLAIGLAGAAGVADESADARLRALRELPAALDTVLAERPAIAAVAASLAPPRRYWAVVGSGPDLVAAAEIRIKLSELCYRSIAADVTEDKKHIDLSCEPLILVCASGLSGPNADDVAKEVAIYRAHKAAPVVIAAAGETARFAHACDVIAVPRTDPALSFVLAAMVGHLFGYEAAVSIDGQALPLRAARSIVEAEVASSGGELTDLSVGPAIGVAVAPFLDGLRAGSYDGNLSASTTVRLVGLLRYVTGVIPIDGYELESGKVASPGVLVADLLEALGDAIDELTRPVDAIKHQAKTVTVGISRNEDALLALPLVHDTLSAGASADLLGYRALRTLGVLDGAVDEVLGFTRYRIDGSLGAERRGEWPTATVIDQGGIATTLRSRTASDPRLRGSKHRAAEEREVTVVRGASDGRTVVLVPEVKANTVTGLSLLHVRFAGHLDPVAAAEVLEGYRGRYAALRDAVTETEPSFDDARLAVVPLLDLLTQPVNVLARQWRPAAP